MQKDLKIRISIDKKTGELKVVNGELGQIANSANKSNKSVNIFGNSLLSLGAKVGGIYAVKEAFDAVITTGFKFNKSMEDSIAGLTALTVATSSNISAMGKHLSIAEKYNLAQKEAIKTASELAKINAETPHSLEQTNQIYKAMYVSMKKAGASNEQMIELTKKISIAAGAAGIEFNSLLAGVDGLATGTVLANSDLGRFLTSLGLSNKKLKESGDVVGLLTSKLKGFKSVDTMTAAVSKLDNAWQQLTGNVTKTIFKDTKKDIQELSSVLSTLNTELEDYLANVKDVSDIHRLSSIKVANRELNQLKETYRRMKEEGPGWLDSQQSYNAELKNQEFLIQSLERKIKRLSKAKDGLTKSESNSKSWEDVISNMKQSSLNDINAMSESIRKAYEDGAKKIVNSLPSINIQTSGQTALTNGIDDYKTSLESLESPIDKLNDKFQKLFDTMIEFGDYNGAEKIANKWGKSIDEISKNNSNKVKETFEDWGKTLNSSISNSIVDAIQSGDVAGAIQSLGASISSSMIQSSTSNLIKGGDTLASAGGIMSIGGIGGVAAGIGLSAFMNEMFGGKTKQVTVEELTAPLLKELSYQTNAIVDSLDDQTKILARFGDNLSALEKGTVISSKQMYSDLAKAILEAKTPLDTVGSWANVIAKAKGDASNIITSNNYNLTQLSSDISGAGGWSDYNVVNSTFWSVGKDKLLSVFNGYADSLLNVKDTYANLSKSLKDVYDKLNSNVLANKRLADAYGIVNEKSSGDLSGFLLNTINGLDEFGSSLSTLKDNLLSDDIRTKIDALAQLESITGESFQKNTAAALDYIDSIKLVGEAMGTSRKNIESYRESFKTQEQLLKSQSDSVGVFVASNANQLNLLFEYLKGGIGGLTDTELSFLQANKKFLDDTKVLFDSINNSIDSFVANLSKVPMTFDQIQSSYSDIMMSIGTTKTLNDAQTREKEIETYYQDATSAIKTHYDELRKAESDRISQLQISNKSQQDNLTARIDALKQEKTILDSFAAYADSLRTQQLVDAGNVTALLGKVNNIFSNGVTNANYQNAQSYASSYLDTYKTVAASASDFEYQRSMIANKFADYKGSGQVATLDSLETQLKSLQSATFTTTAAVDTLNLEEQKALEELKQKTIKAMLDLQGITKDLAPSFDGTIEGLQIEVASLLGAESPVALKLDSINNSINNTNPTVTLIDEIKALKAEVAQMRADNNNAQSQLVKNTTVSRVA